MLALKGNTNYFLKNEKIAVIYSFFENGMRVYSCKNESLNRYSKIFSIKPLTLKLVHYILEKYKLNQIPVINIELTKGCNHKCIHCYNEADNNISTLSLNEFIEIIEKIKTTYEFFKIRLSGGEPTLNPEIVSICNYVMNCTRITDNTIITNGTMSNDLFNKLLDTGTHMQISVYGFEYSTYKVFTKGDISLYSKLINNLCNISENRKSQIELVYYYTSITKNDVISFENFAKKNGISFSYSRIMPLGRALQDAKLWTLNSDDVYKIKSKLFYVNVFKDNLCESNRINICFDGSVTPCPFWGNDSKYVMGNIFSDDFAKIVNQQEFLNYRSKSVDTIRECNTCPMRYLCTGGCRAAIEASFSMGLHKPVYCCLDQLADCLDDEIHLIQMPYPGQFIIC